MNSDLHVIFGAGQVGYPLAQYLQESGKRVRVVKRSPGGVPPDAEVVTGDATDPTFCGDAVRGATTVYHCMNPPYDSRIWAKQVPALMDNLINASGAAEARLVVLDNVYMLGRPSGKALDEDTPHNPCSPLGEIRARAAEALFEAHARGQVMAIAGRASDFYGPRGTLTHVGDQFWPAVLAGKPGRVVVDPDAIHTYHYIPDVARGLATLGCAEPDAYGGPWMLPCRPAETLRQLVARFAAHFGSDIGVTRVPRWLLKVVGVFMAPARELDRMRYQWEEPFVINDQKFRSRFNQEPAAADDAAAATVTWAREHYAR